MRFSGSPRSSRLLIGALLVGVLSVGASSIALAKDDDRAVAEATLREVEGSPKGKELAKEPLARAHEALDRAQRLRDVRDEPRAHLCDGLARMWAETARDIVRAAETENRAELARANATDAGAQVERERALLEEGLGQQGRLRAQLETLEHETKHGPDRTSAVAKDDPKKVAIPGDLPEPLKKASPPGRTSPAPATPKGPSSTPPKSAPAPSAPRKAGSK